MSTPEKAKEALFPKQAFYLTSNLGSMQRYDLTKKIERKS